MDYDLMEYGDYQTDNMDSADSSPQTSTNKYQAPGSAKKFCDEPVVINDDSLDSAFPANESSQILLNDDDTDVIDGDSTPGTSIDEHTSYTPTTSNVPSDKKIQSYGPKIKKINLKYSKCKLTGKDLKNLKSDEECSFSKPRYPLRSRTRLDQVKCRLSESILGKKNLNMLPNEIYYRIFQYLPIQDLCRIQRVNKRFRDTVDNHLVMVKRINFSCGLPFAFLSDNLNDSVLKRILTKTPEVTHILGFYPRKIEDIAGFHNSLTYNGIMQALKMCNKLRSVEIMDLELMSRIVQTMSRVKFHGMFRNRPHSWQEEYVNPFINKNNTTLSPTASSTPSSSNLDVSPFKNNSNSSPNCKMSALKTLFNLISSKQITNVFTNYATYNWLCFIEKLTYTTIGSGFQMSPPFYQAPLVSLTSPIPTNFDKLIIPSAIANLTKLDLVSVCIQHIPKLENIKYLHLKWVRFSSPDPFQNFHSPKIQSFVMNNCVGPVRNIRYVHIYSALARAPQLNRLELVSTRIVEGLFENFYHELENGRYCFRNLQRLVLASNKSFSDMDIATVMLTSNASLNHLALSSSHSNNSLMLCLANANVNMHKLESVILGYQDPYQSILNSMEIRNILNIDSPDHSNPTCKITNRGIAALMKVAPRLVSLHLRHALLVDDPSQWFPKKWPAPIGPQDRDMETDVNDEHMSNGNFGLKSLTLEYCIGITPEKISFILNHPRSSFPHLEMLVLRDMFEPLPYSNIPATPRNINVNINTLNRSSRNNSSNFVKHDDLSFRPDLFMGTFDRFCRPNPIVSPGFEYPNNSGMVNTSTLNDLNSTQPFRVHPRLPIIHPDGFPSNNAIPNSSNYHSTFNMFGMSNHGLPFHNAAGLQPLNPIALVYHSTVNRSPELIQSGTIQISINNLNQLHRLESMGLGHLVSNQLYDNTSTATSAPIKSKRNHDNITLTRSLSNSIIEIEDATAPMHQCGVKRKQGRLTDCSKVHGKNVGILIHKSALTAQNHDEKISPITKKRRISGSRSKSKSSADIIQHSEFRSVSTQTCVCGHIDWLDSDWQRELFENQLSCWTTTTQPPIEVCQFCHKKSNNNKSNNNCFHSNKPFNNLNIQEYECKLCSFVLDNNNQQTNISQTCCETTLEHEPREWTACDASVDTTSLILAIKPQLHKLELKQNSFAHLTTLHMEKVGLTHLVLSSCHRLKSVTLENCPEMQAIVINTGTAPPSDSMPGLRRIRIMRCPKFAIYNLLYHVTRFYPQHDDNLYITYRPFGEYNPLVEKALWLNSESQHVMVSHVYRQCSSERDLEELCSSFDQLFREMLNFSESLIRRDILNVSDFSQVNQFSNGSFLRSQYGTDWDLLADIPWINEVCCSMLPSDLCRSQHADQLYELLSEVQSHSGNLKLRRRGIHFHVQLRDVTMLSDNQEPPLIEQILRPSSSSNSSYLPQPYTDDYIQNTHPAHDINANYCTPSLPDFSAVSSSTPDPFDKILLNSKNSTQDRIKILPAYLRSLIESQTQTTTTTNNKINDDCTFEPDVNEKISFSQNIPATQQTDKMLFRQPSQYSDSNNNNPGSSFFIIPTPTTNTTTGTTTTNMAESKSPETLFRSNNCDSSSIVTRLHKSKNSTVALKKQALINLRGSNSSTSPTNIDNSISITTRSRTTNNNDNQQPSTSSKHCTRNH